MKNLILHPTDISQWFALVSEAEAATKVVLDEALESYIVFLLHRFSSTTQLLDSIIALDFLESIQSKSIHKIDLLRDVGDKSLLLSSLFPGIARKRHVDVDYFNNIGKSAYLSVSELEEPSRAALYLQLSKQFLLLKTLLQALRPHEKQIISIIETVNIIRIH